MSTDTFDWPLLIDPEAARRIGDIQSILAMEYAPPDLLAAWTRQRLAELLTQAMTASDWWRERLGLRPTAPILDAWHEQPVLSREQLAASVLPDAPLATPEEHGTCSRLNSPGNAGPALHFYTTEFAQRLTHNQHNADHERQGRNLSRLRANLTDRMAPHSGPNAMTRGFEPTGEGMVLSRHTAHSDMAGHAKWLNDIKPSYFVAEPQVLAALLDEIEANNLDTPAIEQVMPYGAGVAPSLRAAVRRVWGASVRERYSLVEAGTVATQCPISDGYLHIAATHVVVDVVQADGSACAIDEVGRVLVTALHNYATPVIRYDTGDRAALHSRCPGCGATTGALSQLVGHGKRQTAPTATV